MYAIRLIFFIVWVNIYLFTGQASAQTHLEFDHFTLDDGLPDNWVNTTMTDREGFLWLGTNDGLARFDGQRFRVFRHEEGASNSICGNLILHIWQDEAGRVWSVAQGAGLSCLDIKTGRFENWSQNSATHPLPTNVLTCLLPQGQDSFWIGTLARGLMLLDKKTGKTKLFDLGTDKVATEPLAWNSVTQIVRDPADPQFLWLSSNGRGLVHFDTRRGQAISDTLVYPPLLDARLPKPKGFQAHNFKIETGIISPIGRTGSASLCIMADQPGEVWIGTWSCGLVRLDTRTGQPTFYVPDEVEFLGGNPYRNIVTGIARKSETALWVATLDEGLLVFDIKTGHFLAVAGENRPDIKLNGLNLDRFGRLWVLSRNQGFYRANGHDALFTFHPNPDACANAEEEASEVVDFSWDAGRDCHWFLVRHCGSIFRKKHQDGQVVAVPMRPAPFAAQLMHCLHSDHNDRVWAGSSYDLTGGHSLWKLDAEGQYFVPFEGFGGRNLLPPYIKVNDICDDAEGNIWLATTGAGVLKIDFSQQRVLDMSSGVFSSKTPVNSLKTNIARNIVYIGTENEGVFYRNVADSGTLHPIKIKEPVTSIEVGSDNRVFIGTNGGGLYVFDPQKPEAQANNLRKKNGLADDKIQRISLDASGFLYLATMRGLSKMDTKTLQLENFGKSDGLFDLQLGQKGLLASPAGGVWVGQKGGICEAIFLPKQNNETLDSPPIALTDFYIFEKSALGDTLLTLPENWTLQPDQNNWTVAFSALDLRGSRQTRYAWLLENFDSDWRYCTGCERATYTNLPSGDYRFRVRVVDDAGALVSPNEAVLNVQVLPPFWATTWFLLLTVFTLALLARAIFGWRLRLAQEKSAFKQQETELKARVAEMEMAAMRAQMNPHFIFNCLNSIHTFIVTNDTPKAEMYLSKFSKLIRLVLDNSRSERILLENELETLRFYIEMEQMRFEDRFAYEIRVDPDLPTRSLELPPMLIQPLVENAIWHGLLHKKDNSGRLLIAMDLVLHNGQDLIKIVVEDNGVGRAKAAESKSKSATLRKSHGMKITADRLQVIQQVFKIDMQVEVEDLKGQGGVATGTRVTVWVPV